MNTIGYRNRFYQARQTMPGLDSPKACPPPQAANEQSPPLDSSKAPPPPAEDSENTGDKLQAAIGGQDFEVVAINVDTRNIEKPKAWLQETGIHNLTFYADPSGKLLQVLQRSGHVVGLPTTLMVDANGCEIALMKGPADWASPDAVALVKAALGRPS